MAEKKGEPKRRWQGFTILGWVVGEGIGILAATSFFDAEDYLALLPLAILGAVGGYLVVRATLSRMPDKPESFDFENK